MKDKMILLAFSAFVATFYFVGIFVVYTGLRDIYANNKAKSWNMVEGKIVYCKLIENEDSENGTTYTVEVKYRYSVEGTEYIGSRIAFGYSGGGDKAEQQKLLEKITSGNNVGVRYDSYIPSESVLSFGLSRSALFKVAFGVTWLLFVIGFTLTFLAGGIEEGTILNNVKIFN